MSNQDQIPTQLNIFNDQSEGLINNNVTEDWDGLIYTFCYHSKDNIVNGFVQEYCIDSLGKSNTLMLMNLFKDYKYSITVRKHELPPDE